MKLISHITIPNEAATFNRIDIISRLELTEQLEFVFRKVLYTLNVSEVRFHDWPR